MKHQVMTAVIHYCWLQTSHSVCVRLCVFVWTFHSVLRFPFNSRFALMWFITTCLQGGGYEARTCTPSACKRVHKTRSEFYMKFKFCLTLRGHHVFTIMDEQKWEKWDKLLQVRHTCDFGFVLGVFSIVCVAMARFIRRSHKHIHTYKAMDVCIEEERQCCHLPSTSTGVDPKPPSQVATNGG